ncbi:MAG: hypothetical protein ABFD96_00955 [Armatimonadia bacterium]
MRFIGNSRYWVTLLALAASAPVWANYSWGQMGQFRPGIQLGIVVLVLLVEMLLIRPMTRMTWRATAAAVAGANALSGLFGLLFILGMVHFTRPAELMVLAIPSALIEFIVVGLAAREWSPRPGQRVEWAFIGVLVANLLSAMVTFGYVQANYHGRPQPFLRGREGIEMEIVARQVAEAQAEGAELRTLCERGSISAFFLKRVVESTHPVPLDVAPAWLPWAQMRMVRKYESALPKRLDPEGQGRPMVWTGAPYFAGKRGVVFTDGRFELMGERAFRKLRAVAKAPEVTIPPFKPVTPASR